MDAAPTTAATIDLKPLTSSPPRAQKLPLLPPPAFDDVPADAMHDADGHRRFRLPAPPPPFQRQSAGRCSVQQPMTGHQHRASAVGHCPAGVVSEYFIPRSASAHDLCSAIEMQKIPPPLPPSALRTAAAATLARAPRPPAARDKMVTFEDEKLVAYNQQLHHRSSTDLIV